MPDDSLMICGTDFRDLTDPPMPREWTQAEYDLFDRVATQHDLQGAMRRHAMLRADTALMGMPSARLKVAQKRADRLEKQIDAELDKKHPNEERLDSLTEQLEAAQERERELQRASIENLATEAQTKEGDAREAMQVLDRVNLETCFELAKHHKAAGLPKSFDAWARDATGADYENAATVVEEGRRFDPLRRRSSRPARPSGDGADSNNERTPRASQASDTDN